jgi:hypothetical protein
MIKASLASFFIMDEVCDDLLLLAAGPGQQLSILAKLRFGLSGAELARLAADGEGVGRTVAFWTGRTLPGQA